MRTSLLAMFLAVVLAGTARAQTWTGAAAPDANWSNAGNWIGGVPVSNLNTQVTFPVGSTDPIQNIATLFTLNRVTFTGPFARSVTGNPIELPNSSGGTAPAIVYDGTGSPSMSNQLILTNNLDVRGTGTGTLRLTGQVLSGGGITKSGGFDLVLENASLTGPVNVTGGRLIVGAPNFLAGAVTLTAPGSLVYGSTTTNSTLPSINGSGALNVGVAEIWITNGGTLSGPLSGTTGRLRQTRAGGLTLTGGGTIYGLGVGPPPFQAFWGASTLTISGQPLTLTSTMTDDRAALVASLAAIVRVENGGRLSIGPGATARFSGRSLTQPSASLIVTGANSAVIGPAANLVINGADRPTGFAEVFTVTNGATASWDTITGELVGVSAGGVLTTRLMNGSGGVTGPTSRWTIDTLQGGVTASDRATVTVTGNVNGSIGASLNGAATVSGNVIGTISPSLSGTVTVNGRVTGGATVNGGTATIGSIDGTLGIRLTDPSGGVALTAGSDNTSSTLSGGAADFSVGAPGSLTKVGTGTLTINGNYTFTGITQVLGGSLVLSGGTLTPSTFRLTGGDLRLVDKQIALGATGVFRPEGPGTVSMQNVALSGGFIAGPVPITFTGAPSTLTATTLAAGSRTVLNQNVTFNLVTSGGSTQVRGPAALTWDIGTLTSAGTLAIESGAAANVRSFESSGVITTLSGGVINNSVSPLVLGGGSRTFVGTAAAPGGTINLGGQALELNGGLLVNNGTIVGTTNVNFGSLAMGAGTYGPVNVTTGGRFSPGNSPGRVTSTAVLLGSGSAYQFEINDANGIAGVNWDLWEMSTLGITAGTTPNSSIAVLLMSETAAGAAGPAANFNPQQDYDWVIARTTGGVTGFAPDLFRIDRSGFANPIGIGTFSLALVSGTEVHLRFSAVPEPGAFLLAAAAAGAAWWRRSTAVRSPPTAGDCSSAASPARTPSSDAS